MTKDSNPDLVGIIKERIREGGPISFRDFMELTLYHPEFGYYTSPGEKIGKEGDYYTSPHLTPIFGRLIGKQISEMARLLGVGELSIVEMGAGKGLLAADVLDFLKEEDKDFYGNVGYHIIELSNWLKTKQRDALNEHSVLWHKSLDDLTTGIKGVFISNELVDSFPVHLIIIKEGRLMEIFVDWAEGPCGVEGRFVETVKDPSTDALRDYFSELGVDLPDDYRTEVNLDALKWIERIGDILEKGFVITIDYGYLSDEIYQAYRSGGTLLCYHRHTASEDPLIRIGYQDITSHVNFSALINWGIKGGLGLTGITEQSHFLLNIGIEDYLNAIASESRDYRDYLKGILPVKNLFMPGMGETFKFLIQHKGMKMPSLKGFLSN
ncbi:MAG: SAM-dependent methyltransferase [Nitrospirota bacterium]